MREEEEERRTRGILFGFFLLQEEPVEREQKGRFVALCWIGQIYARLPNPKSSYVADWEYLPDWQKQTDSDMFEAIETQR